MNSDAEEFEKSLLFSYDFNSPKMILARESLPRVISSIDFMCLLQYKTFKESLKINIYRNGPLIMQSEVSRISIFEIRDLECYDVWSVAKRVMVRGTDLVNRSVFFTILWHSNNEFHERKFKTKFRAFVAAKYRWTTAVTLQNRSPEVPNQVSRCPLHSRSHGCSHEEDHGVRYIFDKTSLIFTAISAS